MRVIFHDIKRLKQLEELAQAFDGVTRAYAIQAGREVRVILNADKTEAEMKYPGKIKLNVARENGLTRAYAIQAGREVSVILNAGKTEAEMKYPGKIKLNVARDTRASEFAK